MWKTTGRFGALVERWRSFRIKKKERRKNVQQEAEKQWAENPYLFCFRFLLEQILEKKNISYRDFAPVLIDEADAGAMVLEEDVWVVLHQMEADLNTLTIVTDRPEEFMSYASLVEEENGLLIVLLKKQDTGTKEFLSIQGNVILDFEKEGHYCTMEKKAGYCYIPIYKIPWKKGENLDISVPIGYNTVIVKGVSENKQRINSAVPKNGISQNNRKKETGRVETWIRKTY